MPHHADTAKATAFEPSSFGRGWIPASRDIGLPNDDLPPRDAGGQVDWAGWARAERTKDSAGVPLPQAGGESKDTLSAAPSGGHSFTPLLIARFLEHLSRSGNVRAAALAAGVSQQTAYVRRRRDPAFAAGWEAALLHARAAAEQVLAERAIMGTTETIWYRGEAVGQRQRFDARLLLAHLARLDARAAKASPAIHRLAEEFDDMLLALGEGEAPAEAACLPDPERERFIEESEAEALRTFHETCPEPAEDDDDATWDLWGEVRDGMIAEARTRAEREWDGETDARCARLEALFPGEVEQEVAAEPVSQNPRHPGLDPGSRFTVAPSQPEAGETPSAPCKPRKPLSDLKCGTAAPALLASSLNWPLPAPHLLQATPLPPPQDPWTAWPAAVTGHPC
ncbi:hypothetical protein HGI47_10220 [Novosphingobium sp. ERN07]|uniref:hypothetical protein n=1 Tax=Novosphingobium sp. ERN07 TaxID=2726187 RepID=UPI00145731DD|nr:hypothetical protein [Novosphingobium sp. ERN07]NLR71249.1 hypothetical protein [Novosphingobium sp. ERN07]